MRLALERTGSMAMIKLKRVYERPSPQDGLRVLVDRLWPRGLTKERAAVDLWAKDVAPSTELRKWFGHDPAGYQRFAPAFAAANAGALGAGARLRAVAGPLVACAVSKVTPVVRRSWANTAPSWSLRTLPT